MLLSETNYGHGNLLDFSIILHTRIVGYFDWEVHGSLRNGINGRSTLFEKPSIASGSRMEVGT